MGNLTRYHVDGNGMSYATENGNWVIASEAEAEITRLKGEVERLTMKNVALDGSVRHHNNRAETAEARVKELEIALTKVNIDNGQCFGILQGTEARLKEAEARVRELEAEVDIAVGRALKRNFTGMEEQLKETEAQLAELQARVRPGVEELQKIAENIISNRVEHVSAQNVDCPVCFSALEVAQAIHAILPPAPKVLSLEDCKKLAMELQLISEQISSMAPDHFTNRQEAEDWYEKTKGLEVEAHAQAIHKAMGGGE